MDSHRQFVSFTLSEYNTPGRVKVAATVAELQSQTNAFSVKNRPGCRRTLLESKPKELLLHYNVKCDLKTSDPNGHDVYIHFDTSEVKDAATAGKLDVKVSCTCPAFVFWGPQWNLHQRDALEGEPRPLLAPPTERLDLRGKAVLCIAPNTEVLMGDGTVKRIQDIVPGDMVMTHMGRPRRVTATLSRPTTPGEKAYATRATGTAEDLITSADHPFAVVRGNQVCRCCGAPLLRTPLRGTRPMWGISALPQHRARKAADGWVDKSAGELLWIPPSEFLKKETTFYPKIRWEGVTHVDPDLAALVGYYLAEGNPIMHSPKPVKQTHVWKNPKSLEREVNGTRKLVYGVRFTLNLDEEHTLAKDIVDRLKRLLGADASVRLNKRNYSGKNWINVTVNDSRFASLMIDLVGAGSTRKQLSPEVLSWDLPSLALMLNCYALGDGHREPKSNMQYIYSTSRQLISQVALILNALGVWASHLYQDHQGTKASGVMKKNRYHRLYWTVGDGCATTDPAKNARVSEWDNGYVRSLRWVRETECPDTFYDLTVEEDESFIANGHVVHNCKHIYTCLENILPSVQHNIVKILREQRVKDNKEKRNLEPKEPTKLDKRQQEMQERLRKKKEREKSDKQIHKKLLDSIRRREQEKQTVVERDTPATPGEKERIPVLPKATPTDIVEEKAAVPPPSPKPVEAPPVAEPQPTAEAPIVRTRPATTPLTDIDRKGIERLKDSQKPKPVSPLSEKDRRGIERLKKNQKPKEE